MRARVCVLGGGGDKIKYIMKDAEKSIFDIYYD